MVGLLGCPQTKSINQVLADPSRYANNDVTIKGNVTDSWGVMGTGAYQLDDGTGKLWVVTQNRAVPAKGARVAAQGRIDSSFSLGGKSFGVVMMEKDRHSQ
jgi:hypothetical protein